MPGGQGPRTPDFRTLLTDAVRLLRGDGLDRTEAEALRDTLVQGYRWILVDEYQDVGPEEYALISAVAGRSLEDPDLRISLFAVGDDDQNIYAFAGASVRHIRQFEEDYPASPVYLTENYRSTGHIISAANDVIAGCGRADEDRPRHHRRQGPAQRAAGRRDGAARSGRAGPRADPDLSRRGRRAGHGGLGRAACACRDLIPGFDLGADSDHRARLAKLAPVRDFAEALGIPVEFANETLPGLWRMREMQPIRGALLQTAAAT